MRLQTNYQYLLFPSAEAREAYDKGEVRSGTVAGLMAELDD
ncbi:hypothetical protein [Nostoc sp.]